MLTPNKLDTLDTDLIPIEQAILSAIMLDESGTGSGRMDALEMAIRTLVLGDFQIEADRVIFEAMCTARKAGLTADLVTVCRLIKEAGRTDAASMFYVSELLDMVGTSRNVRSHIIQLKERAGKKRLAETMTNTLREMQEGNLSLEAAAGRVRERIDNSNVSDLDWPSANMKQLMDMVTYNVDNPDKSGIRTGFDKLDEMTRGFQPGDLVIIAARPGQGKTAIALDMARNISREGTKVGFLSLEMTLAQVGERLVSQESGINGMKLRDGKLDGRDGIRYAEAVAALSKRKIEVRDVPRRRMSGVMSCIRNLAVTGCRVIFVDYLQLIRLDSKGESRRLEIDDITAQLKETAKEFDIPIVLLCQLSRATEGRTGGRPQLSDLKESGGIEQDADTVLLLYASGAYGSGDKRTVDLLVEKQRKGPTGSVPLIWDAFCTTFRNRV